MSGLSLDSVLERLEVMQAGKTRRMPVVMGGRTFRECSRCGRMGWHPQASAEICCRQSMTLIEHPSMKVTDYVQFVGFPNTYASGKISYAEVLDMMKREGIEALPEIEKGHDGDSVRPI